MRSGGKILVTDSHKGKNTQLASATGWIFEKEGCGQELGPKWSQETGKASQYEIKLILIFSKVLPSGGKDPAMYLQWEDNL